MNFLANMLTTARFEFVRSLTLQRITLSVILALFPPAMLLILLLNASDALFKFIVCTMVLFVGLLSLLLWATPNVHGELEGRSWSYLTSRHGGRFSILFGKYLNAIIWTVIVSWTSAVICIIETELLTRTGEMTKNLIAFTGLILIATPVYAAIFSMIGVIFSRKSMVFGAAYIVLSELVLASVPANVNKLTGRFHLMTIANGLFGEWFLPLGQDEWETLYGRSSIVGSVMALLLITLFSLGIATVVIRYREYITSDETL